MVHAKPNAMPTATISHARAFCKLQSRKTRTDGHVAGAAPASAEASHSHLGPFPLRPVPT